MMHGDTQTGQQEILFIETSTTGAGASTARFATTLGLSPILITRNAECYSFELRKLFTRIEIAETNDVEKLLCRVRQIISSSRVAGIMTTNDFYVRQTSVCCDEFGYPGLSIRAAECCHNKQMLRKRLAECAPDMNPHYFPLTRTDNIRQALIAAEEIGFPVVVKPVDGNDSVLVHIARSSDELIAYAETIRSTDFDATGQPFSGDVLIEALIPEPEFSLEAFKASDGSVHFIGAFEKEISGWKHAPFIKLGAMFPPQVNMTHILHTAALRVIEAIEVGVGVVDIDCRFDGSVIRILEVNGRIVGDQMGSHLIELATGMSLPQVAVCLAIGKDISWVPNRLEPVSIYRVPAHTDGIFHGVKNVAEILRFPGVVEVIVIAPVGSACRVAQSNQDIVASVITKGVTPAVALNQARIAAQSVELVISRDYNLVPSVRTEL